MKRNFVYLLAALLISAASCSFTNKTFDNPDKDKLLIQLISYVLEKGHFNPSEMDDSFSEKVFDQYIRMLDPSKRYFLQSDMEEFEVYRDQIDDQIKESDITFFELVYTRFVKRMGEGREVYKEILEKPFDFSKNENIDMDYDNLSYVSSKKELKDRWRKYLKFSALSSYVSRIEEEEGKKEEDAGYTMKSPEEVEKEARESTLKNQDDFFDLVDDLERKDWFVMYLNAIVSEFDPHTYYFAPEEKDRFDTSMSGKFEGIGARLQRKNDRIKIVEIISGGPAWRGNEVEVGDEILRVGQGDEEPVDIIGMRLDDAVKLIKGPKGSEVKLTLKKVDGTTEVISIVRDVVELEESYAKSSIVKKGAKVFGVINLPKFYIDFDNYNDRNAASDVEQEIERLKKEGMEGLVLDLRGNGGGSLKTVVDMAGFFIKDGPIVQVKSSGKRKEVLSDTDKRVQWDGPLVILVNELSASASEILAAAMQDYKRAVVIGSKQTYGKGTVQNVIDLNQFLSQKNDFGDVGALKLTTQKFYRINGGSTQLEGVKSDIPIPDRYSYINIGEKDQENPLPWDKIDPASYQAWDGYVNYDYTVAKSKERMAGNPQLALIDENAQWVKEKQDENQYSLNYESYRKAIDQDEKRAKRFDALSDYKTDLTYRSLPYEEALMEKDTVLRDRRKSWHENLSKDVYMEEALNILADLQTTSDNKKRLAKVRD
ncbi:carboxy terminal-processing peptidase [Sinomicrobium weinanense]|uniref:Carboxy terminal-processing peptidase n=1 Tax=Sinomicrobium weinanense TaxID=2842200 RepID=A0A926JUF7_9FLAO|nr:carboxy terminal-processing peptidase [Sinomicrobium weinanense]MBC9797732.1 carboxy terminal-processing peptidase [Sinomicrobium weinanense]MBU3123623.1 carboxy terminal-processing peptidase [Sinomicrobium weinanense]